MAPKDLGIEHGQIWAFREGSKTPLVRARIISYPEHYEQPLTIRLVDDPARDPLTVRRSKLPCRWEDVDAYLAAHPDVPTTAPEPKSAPAEDTSETDYWAAESKMRQIIREEVGNLVGIPRIALNYADAAKAVGYSTTTLRAAVDSGELAASFANSKPVFVVAELERWVTGLPHEPRA